MKTAEDLIADARRALLRGNRWYRRAERMLRVAIRRAAKEDMEARLRLLSEKEPRTKAQRRRTRE